MTARLILLIPVLLAACAPGPDATLRLDEVEVSMHMVLPVESEGRYYIPGPRIFPMYGREKRMVFMFTPARTWRTGTGRWRGHLLLEASGTAVPGGLSFFPWRINTSWSGPSILQKESNMGY